MVWILWATVVTTWAIHTGLHRWKRVRGRRKQTASSQPVTSKAVGHLPFSVTWLRMSEPAKDSGTPPIRTATYLPFNLPRPPGATPPHIPEQRTRLTHIPWDSTSPGLYELRVREAPEAGTTAGGEGQSHD